MLSWDTLAPSAAKKSGTMAKRTLILTLPPMAVGGVTAKARLLVRCLVDAGHDVTVAYYPIRHAAPPKPEVFGAARQCAVAARFPWFEQSYTADSDQWRRLIADHDRHVAVGGTILIANPLAAAGRRHMVWCAGDLASDRRHRQLAMPWWRRLGDAIMVAPALARQQTRVLAADNRIYGVSHDTARRLRALAPGRGNEIAGLPIPVDIDFFQPAPRSTGAYRMGFAGRLDDPRKNPGLLLGVLAELRRRGVDASLAVTGEPVAAVVALANRLGVRDSLTFSGVLSADGLRRFYQGLDVFVMASLHEGLAIAALEAMACGIPVVSTECGGPADYVVNGETGALCPFDERAIADAIVDVCREETWPAMSRAARHRVETDFNFASFERRLAEAWQAVWGEHL